LKPVIVTGGYARKCLGVVTSLGRRGVPVVVGNTDRLGPPLWSRYAWKRFVYPDPGRDPEAFLERVAAEAKTHDAELVFPTGGADTKVLARERARLRVPVVAPPLEKIELAEDKGGLIRAAMEAGVPVPRTYFDAAERGVPPNAVFPLLVRPNTGSGGHGIVKVTRREDLARAIGQVSVRHGRVLVQEYVESAALGFGCSAVMDRESRPVAFLCHRRLREYPVSGGAATFVESIEEPVLQAQAETLLRALAWESVAMTEWRLDARDGLFKLIEINPRMWGSSFLALDAGVDIPWLLRLAHLGLPPGPLPKVLPGVRRRWLIPADLLHFLRNPERFHLHPSFFRFFERGTRYDFLDPKDPLPALFNVLSLARLALTGQAKAQIDRA